MATMTTLPASRRRHNGRTAAVRRERGSSSIQMVILMPALFSIMFLGMQGALYYHARTVAIAAAQEGARAAGSQNGTAAEGVSAASSFVSDAGGKDVLPGAHMTGGRSATTATMTVTGTSLSVIPGWSPAVSQSASVPVERITQ
jgi:Flp pilus assembly protein TadG